MTYKRILTIQDISCIGQCSLTVALPILSACGLETAILPSAVLSTHTAGFSGFTVRDLTEDMPAIADHWKKEDLKFSCVYTGYLGSEEQIAYVQNIFDTLLLPGGVRVVDPAMADNGKLYPAFDMSFVKAMRKLAFSSDIIVPNITEACFLTDYPYQESYDEAYISNLLDALVTAGARNIVLTGVSYSDSTTGVIIRNESGTKYYKHKKISKGCHGTGDVYASAFVGALMQGKSIYDAAKIAADYTVRCIEYTQNDPGHWYGVEFEPVLSELIQAIEK